MTIKAEILDSRNDGNSQCFLAKFSLFDYLTNLPENYKEYDIQREVVNTNVYLDKIIETVLNKNHIPPIVIVLGDYHQEEKHIQFSSDNYKILDGLQRTHRLKMIYDTYLLFKSELETDSSILELKKFQLSRIFSQKLYTIKSNYKILYRIIEFYKNYNINDLDNVFTHNHLWFELWTNLNSAQQVEKMLLLNAGHKPVKLKHQLELLFINDLLKEFSSKEKFNNFSLIREKEMNSTSFSKSRDFGQFHFSQLISSLIAFDKGQIIVTNTSLISQVQDKDFVIQDLSSELSYTYINDFVEFLLDFDEILKLNYSNEIKWFGREASLVGLFAALGNYRQAKEIENPKELFNLMISFLKKHPTILNLNDYDNGRRLLDLSKINFGTVNRKVVFNAFKNLLERIENPQIFQEEPINWNAHFSKFVQS
ncbi:hypothetical protein [Alistipes sp. ZOR0009]|uniref:hypothetical protein n=1 Tax=Alistipes sp. ZOR0009 TaxID=1339253 RepID=UPI0006487C4E|nr:hypothetical protein [Alistipes sp. ZOR0009]